MSYRMALSIDRSYIPMKPWLEECLRNNDFKGLQWHNKNCREFMITWMKQGEPGWEELLEICEAWAHLKKNYSTMLLPSTLRNRLRDNLSKCPGIEEVPSKHVLKQQCGNFKVFRFLTEEEKNGKKKKTQNCGQDKQQNQGSVEILEQRNAAETIRNDDGQVEEMEVDENNSQKSSPSDQMSVDAENGKETLPLESPLPDAIVFEAPPDYPHFSSCAHRLGENSSHVGNNSSSFPKEQLPIFHIQLHYENKLVYSNTLNLSEGYRFHSGNAQEQLDSIDCVKESRPNVQWEDFNLKSFLLPPLDKNQNFQAVKELTEILDAVDQGIILKFEGTQLWAKRRCESRVFYFSSDRECLRDAKRRKTVTAPMKRNKNFVLFSYESYMERLKRYPNCASAPDGVVFISFGRSHRKLHDRVTITMQSVISPFLKQTLCQSDGTSDSSFSSFEKSQENSIDKVVRVFKDSDCLNI